MFSRSLSCYFTIKVTIYLNELSDLTTTLTRPSVVQLNGPLQATPTMGQR